MVKLGLVTLELMLADLKQPVFAGDVPLMMNVTDTHQYETSYADGYDYQCDAGPDEDGCGDGDCGGCGGGCGGGDCGGCSHEMMAAAPSDPIPVMGPVDDIGERDRTKDRSPRPDRKKRPWGLNLGFAS